MDISKLTGSAQVNKHVGQPPKDVANRETAKTKIAEEQRERQDKVEISSKALAAQANQKAEQEKPLSSTETIVKMTDAERIALLSKLQEEQQKNTAKMFDFVRETLASQGTTLGKTDDMWKFIASGEYKVDAQTILEAQQAISEDGHYGVKQTSERIFEFALALTGGDEKQMRRMEEAVSKGFDAAEKALGGELPSITKETYNAVQQKFADYYTSLKPQENE